MHSDYWKGVGVFILAIVFLLLFVSWISRATTYNDNRHVTEIASCQANGYTWGECWDVIVGNQDAFTK